MPLRKVIYPHPGKMEIILESVSFRQADRQDDAEGEQADHFLRNEIICI